MPTGHKSYVQTTQVKIGMAFPSVEILLSLYLSIYLSYKIDRLLNMVIKSETSVEQSYEK